METLKSLRRTRPGIVATELLAGPKSGTGSIEVLDAVKPSSVKMRLLMPAPFRADNTVAWAMSGHQPLLAKAMTLFIDCDKVAGRDFEEGLSNLKSLAENGDRPR